MKSKYEVKTYKILGEEYKAYIRKTPLKIKPLSSVEMQKAISRMKKWSKRGEEIRRKYGIE